MSPASSNWTRRSSFLYINYLVVVKTEKNSRPSSQSAEAPMKNLGATKNAIFTHFGFQNSLPIHVHKLKLPTSLDHVNHFVDLRSCGVARPNVGIRSELSPIPSDVKDELASAPIPVILRTKPCSFSNLHGLCMIYLSSTNPLRQVLTFTQIPINQTPTRPWLILTPLGVFYHLSRDVCVPHMY